MTLNAHANLFQMVGHLAAFHRPCSFTYAWHHNRQHAREGLPLWLWDAHNRFHDDDDGIHYAYRQTRDTDDYDGGWLHLFISLWNIVIICIVGILEPPPSCLRSGLPVFFFCVVYTWPEPLSKPATLWDKFHLFWTVRAWSFLHHRASWRRNHIPAEGNQTGGGDITCGSCALESASRTDYTMRNCHRTGTSSGQKTWTAWDCQETRYLDEIMIKKQLSGSLRFR